MANHVTLVEVNERDALDTANHFQGLDEARHALAPVKLGHDFGNRHLLGPQQDHQVKQQVRRLTHAPLCYTSGPSHGV